MLRAFGLATVVRAHADEEGSGDQNHHGSLPFDRGAKVDHMNDASRTGRHRRYALRGAAIALVCLLSVAAQAQEMKSCAPEPPDEPWFNRTGCVVETLDVDKRTATHIRSVMRQNMEQSYITAGSGVRIGGDQSESNLLYEGQIFVNLNWMESKDRYLWIDVPIRIVVRQYRDSSTPVLTPTYNPGVRLLWHLKGAADAPKGSPIRYVSLGGFHYSNGQSDPSLFSDGTVNTRSGSFNTNYVEAAYYEARSSVALQWWSLTWRHHFTSGWDSAQLNQYEKGHLSLKLRTGDLSSVNPWNVTVTGTYAYTGRDYVVWNGVDPTQNVKASASDNLQLTVELTMVPNSRTTWWWNWKDVGLYVRYDHGYDYYNINFQHKLNRIQFGVAGTNF